MQSLVERLIRIKTNLEHARRFQLHPNDHLKAVVQAEGDLEEILIDYGFKISEDREADPKVHVAIDHQVAAGSGHNGNFRNRTYEQAKAIYDEESKIPSYLGRGFQSTTLMRITTITETLEKNR